MTDIGKYLFLPWLRRGAATQIIRADGTATTAQARAAFDISVAFQGALTTRSVSLALYGPGDVIGFDARAVLRTWPAANVFEAESNCFPLIEFDQPDLPWRYTAATADSAKDRLRPWLCLIALKDDEFEIEDAAGQNRRLPVVKVKPKAPLPNLDEAWAWAHAQVIGAPSKSAGDVQRVVNLSPRQAISRIICPRRLDPKTPYTGFLVPVFERGRLAGLNQPQDEHLDAMQTAWSSGTGVRPADIALPIYYHWRFQTGGEGDFESLVRKLTPRRLPPTVGKRDMLVDEPGAGLPSPVASAEVKVMALEGALRPPDATTSEWRESDRNDWIARLKALLNLSHDRLQRDGEKTITPPLYGRWHAARETLDGTSTARPIWFEQLNIDPRLRVNAGLGALVVQDQRESLLASAWQQVERIRAINEELRLAQLAREAAKSVKERNLDQANTDSLLTVTSPVHSMIAYQEATVASHLEASPIPKGVLDPGWRRVARRMGPLGARQGRDTRPPGADLLERLNEGRLQAAPPPPQSPSLPVPTKVTRGDGRLDHDAILSRPTTDTLPYEPDFTDRDYWQWAVFEPPFRQVPPGHPRPDIPIDGTVIKVNTPPTTTTKKKVDLEKIKDAILKALDPEETITKPLRKRLRPPPGWNPQDPIEPVMAYPDFPQPMYEPLRDLSQEWLFPGLDKVESNTLALLAPNQLSIEAYLVGLNYEMARALLFNEYPTDQRGSYFRQFWDVRGCATPATAKEFEDIKPINEWSKTAKLGENGRRPPGQTLVLLIRGDVLQRYPNAIVYAVKAVAGTPRRLGDKPEDEKHPIFFGKMKPDVTFVGFGDLTAAQAKGSDADPGWFFVIQEQPTEPRFGLVAPETPVSGDAKTPDELSWRHFAKSDADLEKLTYLSFGSALPPITNHEDARWPDPRASDIAFVTLRRPYRVAIHASEMLP
ncbi:MAG TPA: hypothetical protein VJ464_06960 [Blastocatellia bacterium]|nr:hypothetical protein [Blastocatellia bacterium]